MKKGVPRPPFCHWISAGSRSSFRKRLLPMKLSSTKNTDPRQPSLVKWSNSVITCAVVLVRGRWPNMEVMLQNSQSNGQPRENCRLSAA